MKLADAIYINREKKFLNDNDNDLDYLQAQTIDAIDKGYVPYDENGKPIGFDSFKTSDGRTIGEVKAGIAENSEHFKTKWGRERALNNLESRYSEIELKAQLQINARENAINEQLKQNEIIKLRDRAARGETLFDKEGNEVDLETAIRSILSDYPMSNSQRELETQNYLKEINNAIVRREVESIAATEGFDAAVKRANDAYSAELIDDKGRSEMFGFADRENNIAMKALDDEIQNRQNQHKEAGTPILATYNDMMDWAKTLPTQQRARVEEAANKQKEISLRDRFGDDLGGINRMSLNELNYWYNMYQNREADYIGQNELHKNHLDQIYREIESRQGSGSSSSSGSYSPLEMANNIEDRWRMGDIGGVEAMTLINSLDITAGQRRTIFDRMLSGQDGQFSQFAMAFRQWETFAAAAGIDESRKKEIDMHLWQMRFQNDIKQENMLSYINDVIIKQEQAEHLGRAGQLLNWGQTNTASLRGELDYLSYNAIDVTGNRHTMNISGGDDVLNQLNATNTQRVQNILSGSGWQMEGTQGRFEERTAGDRTGQVHFDIVNSSGQKATVRVGENGSLEKQEGNRWVSFDNSLAQEFQANLPQDIYRQVHGAMTNTYPDAQGRQDLTQSLLRARLSDVLGNRARTPAGNAYIEKMINDYFNDSWRALRQGSQTPATQSSNSRQMLN